MQDITKEVHDLVLRKLSEKQDVNKGSKFTDVSTISESIGLDRNTISKVLEMLDEEGLILNGTSEASICALIRYKGWEYLRMLDKDKPS